VPVRLLGIGLPLTIALGAVAAAAVFGELTVDEAVILAVVLAPTDAAFAVIVIEESSLSHETLIVQAIYLTVGLSVLAHGVMAAPLADRSARGYEQHPREKAPPMESAPAEVTRPRGPAGHPT
jgi:NhaP-type Na+/H+ or K+/H+ antiporter